MTDGVVSDLTAEQIAAGFNFVDAAGAGYKFERASNQKLKQLAEYAFGLSQRDAHATHVIERTSSEFLGLAIAAGMELVGRTPGADLTADEIEAYNAKIVEWRRGLPRVAATTPA